MGRVYFSTLYTEDIEVNGTDVAWSRSFELNGNPNGEMAVEVQFEATGEVNVKMELELSNERGAVEQVSDVNFVIGDRDTPIGTVTDELLHFIGFNNTPAKYGRIKFTGLSGNSADTVCKKINHMEVA